MATAVSLSCSICLNPMLNDLVQLPCGHQFHRWCITKWVAQKNECPLGRCVIHGAPSGLSVRFFPGNGEFSIPIDGLSVASTVRDLLGRVVQIQLGTSDRVNTLIIGSRTFPVHTTLLQCGIFPDATLTIQAMCSYLTEQDLAALMVIF